MNDFSSYDALGLADLVRRRKVSPVELLEDTIRHTEMLNPRLNAVICTFWERARAEAKHGADQGAGRGERFPGVPFLLKNLTTDLKGEPFDDCSRFVYGHRSEVDSDLVKRLRAAGLVIAGRTNASELGVLTTAEPVLYGPARNPWSPGLTTGGSSGGSAAAVAAGIVPMAHGNDGGGSIRIPASCCGVFGLKPSRGRLSLGPLFGDFAHGIVCEHALTRSVRDSAALLDATAGYVPGDPYTAPPPARPWLEATRRAPGRLRIGYLSRVPDGWNTETALHPDCLAAVEDAAALCASLGHVVEEADPVALAWPDLPGLFIVVFESYVGHAVAYWERVLQRTVRQEELEPVTWDLYQAGKQVTSARYLVVWEELQRFSRKVASWYVDGRWDVLLSPTMQIPPTKLGAFDSSPEDPGRPIRVALSMVAFTRTQNITGDPAASLPLYWNAEGIPIGVQLAATYGREDVLFRLAAQLEKARPWADRRPPLHSMPV